MNDKQQETNDKIINIYQESQLSIDDIISSLKHLLATAQMSQERVDK